MKSPIPRARLRFFARRIVIVLLLVLLTGCAAPLKRKMHTTAYCGCESCCEWERGSWKYLKLDFWNRYITKGKSKGKRNTGRTAKGTKPREPEPGLLSMDSLQRPWDIPFKIVFPWRLLPRDGTIAADTRYYPFGTRMFVPGYGWGVVEDRGGAIKGPRRLDLFHQHHRDALRWGRKDRVVTIYKP